MVKLFLFDPTTEISVECPNHDKEGNPDWSLREAVQQLTNKIVEETGASIHGVLFGNESFHIIARNSEDD